MPSTDPTSMSVHELSREIGAGRLSPVDVTDAFLDRIARLEPSLHAYVDVYADDARLAARGADAAIRAGHRIGPLHGIPIGLKDLIDMQGRVATGGTQAWRTRVATRTATVARRLIAQGMIVLGKTHTVEFAMGGWGTNTHLGTPRNPWDMTRARTPGGSSSGSGVAVAARLAPCAIGTDTGGSIRLPSAWCGLTGLKVTIGRVSTYGVLPLSPTLDTPGPMTGSVEDATMLYGALQGGDPLDPRTAGVRYTDPLPGLRRGVRGLRLARIPAAERAFVSADVLAAYDRSLETLAQQGAELVDIALPFAFADLSTWNMRIMSAESYAILHALIDDPNAPLDPDVRPRIAAGRSLSSRDYLEALATRDALKLAFAQAMDGVDALLTPTTTTTALPLEDVDQTGTPGHFTRFANFLELCALAVPNGMDPAGLPTSLQIVCRGYEEATALRIGQAWQSVTDWHLRRPAL